MKGKSYSAVVYDEVANTNEWDEADQCFMHFQAEEINKTWNKAWTPNRIKPFWTTCTKESVTGTFSMKVVNDFWTKLEEQNKKDIDLISGINPYLTGNWKELKKYKGEKSLLKIILENVETKTKACFDVPESSKNSYENLKIGDTVYYVGDTSLKPAICKIIKLVDPEAKKKLLNPFFGFPMGFRPYKWQLPLMPRGAGRNTAMFGVTKMKDIIKDAEAKKKAMADFTDRKYFNVRLDFVKGRLGFSESYDKIQFPCWCLFKTMDEYKIGMLVTGFPRGEYEYQLLNMTRQENTKTCTTVKRSKSLEELMESYKIEIIKGETQCWKVGSKRV